MLNSSMNDRENQCQSLDDFTKKIHQEIVETISTLNWTIESIGTDNDDMLICPYDSSHQVSKKMLYQHLECCQLKHEGYNEFDIPLPESCLPLNSYSSIKLDSQMQNSILQKAKEEDSTLKIASYECSTWHRLYFFSKHEFLTLIIGLGERLIPRTSNRIFTDFTCDERKILYDYVTSNTVKPDIGHDITDIQKLKSQDKEDKKLSFLELLIQERNLKRRRAKHRGVHTNKKSHIEVLREVIQQQMELYTDYITEAHATNRDTNTTTEIQSSSNSLSDTINEFPLKCNDVFIENTQDHRGHSSSQYNKKYEYFEKSYTTCLKDSKQRESSRVTTESRKAQKLHKHKRSHSRDRDHDRKSKHGSTRTHHKKSRKSDDKSFDSNTSKRSNDRREKLIL